MTAATQPPTYTSELRAVTVFRSGAVCTRIARLDEGAPACVRVVGLPLSLATFSLRARVVGAAIEVLSVRAAFEVELAQEVDLAGERTALDEAGRARARLQQQVERLERELAELRELQPRFREPPRREPPRAAPIESMLALVELVDTRLDRLTARRRELQRELEDAERREQLHAHRLAEASSARRTERARVGRAAIVTLSAAPQGTCELALEYEVGGARWTPSYQLTLLPDGEGGTLAMRASIAQRTGEDWGGVRVSLSTASLLRRTELPELRSLRIGRAQPEPRAAGWREPPPGLDGLFADYDTAIATRPRAPVVDEAREVTRRSSVQPPMQAPQRMQAPMAARAMSKRASMIEAEAAAPRIGGTGGERAELAGFGGQPEAADMLARMADDALAYDAPADDAYASSALAPTHAQLDYDGLHMHGPEVTGARGKLAPRPSAYLGVVVGVRVDIVVGLVEPARRDADAIASLPLPRDHIAVAAQDRFDYRFDARAPADVPSTGTWVSIAVMDCDLELRPRYLCVPAIESRVYRTLELRNRSSHALLPGPVDVVKGGQFLLTTALPPIPPGAEGRRLGLGVEEAIKVARNLRFAETTGGLFGGAAVLTHEIAIELDNRLGVAAQIEVRERVPVADADEKDLEVKEHGVAPPWSVVDTPQDGVLVHGLRRWQVEVPAHGKTALVAEYTIRMPGDRILVGGNRRS